VLKHRDLSGVLYDASLAAHGFNDNSFLLSLLPIGSAELSQGIHCAAAAPVFLVSNIPQKSSKSDARNPAVDNMICCSCSLKFAQANTGAVAAQRIKGRRQSKSFLQLKAQHLRW
jgi:hypothetical protein